MESATDVLRVTELSKSYGGLKAMDNVSFSVKRGEVMALVGDNGAGKSTLVKALSGAQPPDSGQIESNIALSKGETVQEVWGGPFVMIDKDSDADALVAEATRHSEPKMAK